MIDVVTALSSLGGTVTIAGMMIWYMAQRDKNVRELADNGHAVVRELTLVISEFKTELVLQRETLKGVCKYPSQKD